MSISFAVLATKGGDTLRDAFPSHRTVTVYRLAFGNRLNRVSSVFFFRIIDTCEKIGERDAMVLL
ncbi:hypothetical protein YC2023_101206 [Brassica napus]